MIPEGVVTNTFGFKVLGFPDENERTDIMYTCETRMVAKTFR